MTMAKLDDALSEFIPPAVGGPARRVDRKGLVRRLREHSKKTDGFFLFAALMVACSYGALIGLIWYRPSPALEAMPIILAAAGLTWWMTALWREKTCTELLIAFAADFPEEVLTELLLKSKKAVSTNLKLTQSAKDLLAMATPAIPDSSPK